VRAIERYDIEHVEQPVARGDLLGLAEVRRGVGIPVMTDDAVATPQDAMNVIRLGAADRVKVKVTKHGLDGAASIIVMLEAAGIPCVLGHVFEMGLGALPKRICRHRAQHRAAARNRLDAADGQYRRHRVRGSAGRAGYSTAGQAWPRDADWARIDALRTDGGRGGRLMWGERVFAALFGIPRRLIVQSLKPVIGIASRPARILPFWLASS
jgi:hypothetical protein